MKRLVVSCLLFAVLLMLNGCSVKKADKIIDNSKEVVRITIKTLPGNDISLKSTEDKKQISELINYINALDLKKTTKDAGQYSGMAYIINLFYEDQTSKEYVHFGNMFFKESGKDWYEIPYKQAEKFESIYNSLGVN
jgi:hypothetical protein